MGKITFVSWLIKQSGRGDTVGDLASDMLESGLYDDPKYTYRELRKLAKERGVGKNILDALKMAHEEWGMLLW